MGAQSTKPPIQKLADVVSGYFVPIVIVIAILSFAVWFFVGPETRLAFALITAVSVLIIVLSVMTGFEGKLRRNILGNNAHVVAAAPATTTTPTAVQNHHVL